MSPLLLLPQRYVFSSKSQHALVKLPVEQCCCCYHKGTYFQANHNWEDSRGYRTSVVVATTKVRIFKQITTRKVDGRWQSGLLLLPQRYVFSSKSQHERKYGAKIAVVVATTKVRIFKQITTVFALILLEEELLLLPQRYVFSSKSQLSTEYQNWYSCCCCYHKGTYFQANHNWIVYI